MNIYNHFIDGEQVGCNHRPNVNPSDIDDIIGHFARANSEEVESAITAAKHAFPKWSSLPPYERGKILRKASDLLLERKNTIGETLSREEGKTLAEGIGEVVRASQVFDFFASECTRLIGESIASVRQGVDITVRREPLGVVGIITPWNFPIAIPAWKIAPALCYGNTVVFKPADLVPASAWMLVKILHEAGLPSGVLNLVMGQGSVIGDIITHDPRVDAVTFTGSVNVGQHIAETCAKRLCRVQLEMGGKNPLIVLDDADLDIAVECAINGAYFSTGQRCTASSRLIVTSGIHDKFVDKIMKALSKTEVGHSLDPNTKIGPVVDEKQLKTDLDYIEIGKEEGAELAWGGKLIERRTPGYYLSPALFTGATSSMKISQEEIFGPVASLIKVKDFDESIQVANDIKFGLAAGICTKNLRYATEFQRRIEAGMCMVNLPTAGVDFHVPFGGRKGSSYGPKEQGRMAQEFYTNVKTSYSKA